MLLCCTGEVEDKSRQVFCYAFARDAELLPAGYIPKLTFRQITERPFTILGEEVIPIPLVHARFNVFGFRIGDLAYCTDVNRIPDRSWPLLKGLRILVLDALRHKPHPRHLSINDPLEIAAAPNPGPTYLTPL